MPQLTFDDYWIRPIMTDRRCRRHGEALSTVELRNEGHEVTVPFAPRRTDALQEQTDVEMFAVLESADDGFRNYLRAGEKLPARTLLLDRANLLRLTAPQIDGSDRRPSAWTPTSANPISSPSSTGGNVDQRLLREPAGHVSAVTAHTPPEGGVWVVAQERVRAAQPQLGQGLDPR
jgi:hypothetical protein